LARKISNIGYPKLVDPFGLRKVTPKSSAYIAVGDLVEYDKSNHYAIVLDAADSDAYLGISMDYSDNTSDDKILVACKAYFKATLASAAQLDIGDGLVYSAGSNTADWEFTTDSNGANIIAWAAEGMQSSASTLDALTDSFGVAWGARAATDTALWEIATT